jgi:hypothetical protein
MDAAAVTVITDSVDFATIITGIGAVAAALVVVFVTTKGVKMLLGMVKAG